MVMVRCRGLAPPAGISVVQKTTPAGDGRGTVVVTADGTASVLETGTLSVEWKMLKELEVGPKGKKGVVCVSAAIVEAPLGEVAVVTTRGGGRVVILACCWSMRGF